MKRQMNIAVQTVKRLTVVVMLFVTSSVAAVDFPQYLKSISLIEADTLPIEVIKLECMSINVEDNYGSCISNTMSQWANFRRALKEIPEIADLCYNSLRELDDFMLVNKCIDASVQGNS